MKTFFSLAIGLAALGACAGCGQMPFGQASSARQPASVTTASTSTANPVHAAGDSGHEPGGANYAMDDRQCAGLANNRLSLYDKPAPFATSPQDKLEAYQSLYSSCMRGHDWEVAGPVHSEPLPPLASPTNFASDAAQFANLSPAAGGGAPHPAAANAGGTAISTSSVAGATVVVIGGAKELDPAQLSSLGSASGSASPAPPVVLVQAQPAAGAIPASYVIPAAASPLSTQKQALPVAVPVPPLANAYVTQPHSTLNIPTVHSAQMHATEPKHRKKPASEPQPSLAGAESDLAADSPQAAEKLADRQLETVLEK